MKRYLNLKTNKEGCNVLQNRVQLHCSKNFYLNTPMARKEYMRKMRLQDISQENIDHYYELKSKVDNKNGFVYVEIGKGLAIFCPKKSSNPQMSTKNMMPRVKELIPKLTIYHSTSTK